jgi:type I restriction enzyme S subunit
LRRRIFRREDIGQVYVYSTSPVSKIVGSFEVGGIIEDSPEFFEYFAGAVTAFAIKIANMQRFANPLDPSSIFDDFKPPQSFRYLPIDISPHRGNGKRGRAVQRAKDSGRKKARKH